MAHGPVPRCSRHTGLYTALEHRPWISASGPSHSLFLLLGFCLPDLHGRLLLITKVAAKNVISEKLSAQTLVKIASHLQPQVLCELGK